MKNIFEILDQDYINKLFENKKLIYFPELKNKNIISIEIEKISPSWAKETCLAKYKVLFNGDIIKIIRGKASLDKTNMQAWRVMEYLCSRGFSDSQLQIAKPLDLIKENSFLLYEDAQGMPLSLVIQNGDFDKIIVCIKKVAVWLAKLHQIKAIGENLPEAVFIKSDDFVDIFSRIANIFTDLRDDLVPELALKFIAGIQSDGKTLIHNDFYPGNIIVGNEVIYGIDFEKSGLGSRWLDVAAFLGWMEFPAAIHQLNLTYKKIQEIQTAFFETYCLTCQIDCFLAKQSLNKYLAKIYLDQIYYYTVFCAKGWDFFGDKDKCNYEIKIKALLREANKNLK